VRSGSPGREGGYAPAAALSNGTGPPDVLRVGQDGRAAARGGPWQVAVIAPTGLDPVKSGALPSWPGGAVSLPCDPAGLLLLLPAIAQIGLPGLIVAADYPSTEALTSWHPVGTAV
jgi:hypothetical protein